MKNQNKTQTNTVSNLGRHGDLLIKRIENTTEILKKTNVAVLAVGEHTNHSHRLTALDKTTTIEFADFVDHLTFRVSGGNAQLTHEEHKQIVFEPGTYQVTFEREFDYFDQEIKKVLD